MSSRLFRGLAVTLGAGALMTAAFTQGVTPPPASTVQAGTHGKSTKPMPLGLIPTTVAPKPQPKQQANTEVYDYINPCSLLPLDVIHKITRDYRLKFNSIHGGLTSNVSDAAVTTLVSDPLMPKLCMIDPEPGNVKPTTFVGVKTQQSTEQFETLRRHWQNNSYYNAQDVDVAGLPNTREAFMPYTTVNGQRFPSLLFVRTASNQTLVVSWSGKFAVPVMRQLAYEALRTLDGSRYPGK